MEVKFSVFFFCLFSSLTIWLVPVSILVLGAKFKSHSLWVGPFGGNYTQMLKCEMQ